MCGRFSQSLSRDEYLSSFQDNIQQDISFDPTPIGRYNVAPGTRVLLLSTRSDALHLDPVLWSYAPGWWDKPPLINARVETASTSRMFKSLWLHGRSVVFADGWFEWVKEGNTKQPYFIRRKDQKPVFLAAIGSVPFERGDNAEGFLIVTSAAQKGLLEIHNRRPVIFSPDAALQWMHPDLSGKDAEALASLANTPPEEFEWYPVPKAVGNVKNQGPEVIIPTK